MKQLAVILSVCLSLFWNNLSAQNVGINTTGASPHGSAGLDINFNNKGLLMPRLSVDERNDIDTPATGLLIYNSDCNNFDYYNGTAWVPVNNIAANVSIEANPSGAICAGTSIIFTATPANGGTSPVYQWKKNGTNVGTNSSTYTNSSLSNGDVVTCVMTSNAPCVTVSPATSNSIAMVVNSSPVTPGTITGSSVVYLNQSGVNYSVAAISGATSYAWTVPSGASVTSGGTTNAVTVTFGTSAGDVCATASNSCGTNSASCTTISNHTETFDYSGSITTWTVPASATTLIITANGGSGGNTFNNGSATGGTGASMKGTFSIAGGTVLKMLVGQKGQDQPWCAGGGGGTFLVYNSNNSPIIIAGGGSGGNSGNGRQGRPGLITTNGGNAGTNLGGTAGSGGNANTAAAAGGGLIGDGAATTCVSNYQGGKSFINGGAGAIGSVNGGFGGGSGGDQWCYASGGAGGGYSGGAGAPGPGGNDENSGGGGSYNGGTNQTNVEGGAAFGNGQIIIVY